MTDQARDRLSRRPGAFAPAGREARTDVPVSFRRDRQALDAGRIRSPWVAVRRTWHRHQDLLRNLLALLATTGLTSTLGFAYWNIAARIFSQQAVGYGTAAVSAMTLISSVGVFGLSTLLIGDLPRRQERAGLISAAMLAAAGGSLLLALAFVLVIPHFTTHYNDVAGSVRAEALFCAGVALTAMSVVFDAATIGMQRGSLQLMRNLAFVVIKLLTLIGTAAIIHYSTGIAIFASWIAATPLALVLVAIRLFLSRAPILARPDWKTLRSLGRTLVAHNWLNLALQVPALITPVLVASILAPATNAAYYIAMTICTGLYILPMHMSTSLFAATAGDNRILGAKLRFALRVSLSFGIPGMLILGVGAHFILGLFGRGYAEVATVPMQLIVLNYLPRLPVSYYISVSRATGRLSRAALIMTVFAAADVVAVVAGCVLGGLVGMTGAALAVSVIEAMVTGPIVLRAAVRAGKHRRDETRASGAASPPRRQQYVESGGGAADLLGYQQRAGLALLLSMATPVAVNVVVPEPTRDSAIERNAGRAFQARTMLTGEDARRRNLPGPLEETVQRRRRQ